MNDVHRWKSPNLFEVETGPSGDSNEPDKAEAEFNAAREKGYQEGKSQAAAETALLQGQLKQIIHALGRPLEDQDAQLAELIANLARIFATTIVHKEFEHDPELIMQLAKDAVSAIDQEASQVQIHLSPKNAVLLQSMSESQGIGSAWKIVEDPLLGDVDCRVTSMDSLVDGNLESRLEHLVEKFLEQDETD